MPNLTPDQIRALDDRALTRLAFDLGLAPAGSEQWDEWLYDFTQREDWEPATNLVQADAVFRSLRARGWRTQNDSMETFGVVLASKCDPQTGTCLIDVNWGPRHQMTETHALLLCAVLAVASEGEAQG